METKLEELMSYVFPFAVGHTWTEVNGVKNNPKAVLIVATERMKKQIDLPKEQVISFGELPKALQGRQCPVVIDHALLKHLISSCIGYYKDKIEKLEKRIEGEEENEVKRVV